MRPMFDPMDKKTAEAIETADYARKWHATLVLALGAGLLAAEPES